MRYAWFSLFGLVLILVSACSGVSQRQPVPVEERSVGNTAPRPGTAGPMAEDGTAQDRPSAGGTSASDNPVVIAMLEDADSKRRSGNRAAAVSSLERALAMEPKNAFLWHRLAVLRLEQENWQQAYVLANKSNSLVRDNPALKISNWEVIAAAKRQQGDEAAVREAEQAIRRLHGQ